MEYVDIFDINYNHIGTEEKTTAHLKGLWHQVFHCWIIRPDNKILLQLRSKDKPIYPDLLDISAAGHIAAGETPIEGLREIKEELGIDVDEQRLRFLGTYQEAKSIETPKGTYYEQEFSHMYFLKDDTKIDEYIMQAEEVDGIYEIAIDDIYKLFGNEQEKVAINGFSRIKNDFDTISVSKERFAPRSDEYYLKLAIMAERFCNNEKYLGF